MKKTRILTLVVIAVLFAALAAGLMAACQPVEKDDSRYKVIDNEDNLKYKELSTKDEAVERATGSLQNLLDYLDTETVSETGYFVGADMKVNTEDGSAFVLKMRANLYTYPYENFEEGTPEYDAALAKHNELIKKNDIILEWYDGATNTMLIGFYYDGINQGSADKGNNLYLNIQGSKRLHPNFGDTVFYQQLIRLITKFSLDSVLASTSGDGSSEGAVESLSSVLKMTVTDNYVVTQNRDIGSIFFHDLSLTPKASEITEFMHKIFAPFGDKLDPLTFKYLGFLFSTLGKARFTVLNADMRFLVEANEKIGKELLHGVEMDVDGDAAVKKFNKALQKEEEVVVPFTSSIGVKYSLRVATDLVFDKENYVLYDYGNYEYGGDMYLPHLDLRLDMLVRTDVNKWDNEKNKVFMQCRELDTDKTVMAIYYKDELTYLDIKGITELYGGVHVEDIGLPQAYRGGFDLASTLMWFSDFVDKYIVIAVDNILNAKKVDEGKESKFGEVTRIIMDNVESQMKDEEDPASRATIRVKIDMDLIREVMTATSDTGTNFTNEQLIQLINNQFNIDIEAIAAILGVSVDELIDKTFVYLTYDVDFRSIKLEVYSAAEKLAGEEAELYLRMTLYPHKIGEYVPINFGDLSKFKEMQDIMTYSGKLEGQFIFANDEIVDMSGLLGSFMGDKSGLNTPYLLPYQAKIDFELYYDQYIREQILSNGRWTRRGRSAFDLRFNVVEGEERRTILRIYGNDVNFNSSLPIEEHGYVWLDYVCVPELPKFKVREDLFLTSFYEYMGYDFDKENPEVVLGLTDIIRALMEDSWVVYEPEVIRITTSNKTVKKFFNVDKMIATFNVGVRFKQQVFNVDQLSREFAMYTVGDLADLTGPSPYYVKLHDTIKVYFDFGDRFEERDFFFTYDESSIEMVNGREFYRPALDDRFMGVTRDYQVRITDRVGRQVITGYKDKRQEWEPLNPTPTTVVAYCGADQTTTNLYDAEYILHAAYHRETGYYTVYSDYGYQNVYDHENDVYVLSLGSELNFKKAYEELGDVKTYLREYVLENDIAIRYEFESNIAGVYVVTKIGSDEPVGKALYLKDHDIFVAFGDEIETQIRDKDYSARIYRPEHRSKGVKASGSSPAVDPTPFYLDLKSASYYAKVSATIGGELREIGVRYNLETKAYNFPRVKDSSELVEIARTLRGILGEERVIAADDLDYSSKDLAHVSFAPLDVSSYDWNDDVFGKFSFENLAWEDMTLEGGLFIVKATVGRGMMATYVENIVIKVLNRTVDTDKYVVVNTPDGKIQAPVATGIDVDPYVYLIYKAYYVNVMRGKPEQFATWFFDKFELTFKFTKIYVDNPEEDTKDEVARFRWHFDYLDGSEVYVEEQIHNRNVKPDLLPKTYVYTVFNNQVIALELRIPYRQLKEFYVEGEELAGTYTVDALDASTYDLPKNLRYVFEGARTDESGEIAKDAGGNVSIEEYSLDFEDIPGSTIFRTLQSFIPAINGLPRALKGTDLVKWANPVANNVKLINDQVAGHVKPFLETDSNLTTSSLDFLNCFDKSLAWYYEDWFHIPQISLTVEIPDKVISSFDREVYGKNHVSKSESHDNVQIAEYAVDGDDTNETWGFWAVDPYDESTWILPRKVIVHFDGKNPGEYSAWEYEVAWRKLPGDMQERIEEAEGGYRILGISKMPAYFRLEAVIGEESTTNHILFKLIVVNRSGHVEKVEFLDASGNSMSAIAEDPSVATSSALNLYTTQKTGYRYDVDTYKRFEMPASMRIEFKDHTLRSYKISKWGRNNESSSTMSDDDPAKYRLLQLDPWHPNTSFFQVANVIGSSIKEKVFLAFKTATYVPISIKLNRHAQDSTAGIEDDYSSLSISNVSDYLNGTDIVLGDINIDENGMVLARNSTERLLVDGNPVNAYQYVKYLFGDIEIEYSNSEKVRILDAATSADDMLYAVVDLQKMLKDAATGQTIRVYLGQGSLAHDLKVQIRISQFTTANVHDLDFMGEDRVVIKRIALEAFNSDNTPKYPDGYSFRDRLSFTIAYKNGTIMTFGPDPGQIPLPLEWSVVEPPNGIVEPGGLDKMMGRYSEDDFKFSLYDRVSSLDTETIYAGGYLWVSAMLPDASRVYVRFESIGIEIGDNYDSADPTSRFVIESGVLTLRDLYNNYPLANYLVKSQLPTVVRLSNGLEFDSIDWKVEMDSEKLDSIDHKGNLHMTEEQRLFATARIMRETVKLRLDVLPVVVNKISYGTPEDGTLAFETGEKDINGIIRLDFDIYQNLDYAGQFLLPLNVRFEYEGRPGQQFDYHGVKFTYAKSQGASKPCLKLPYDLEGIDFDPASEEYKLLDDERSVLLQMKLKDGQIVKLLVHVNDKTITEYEFENLGVTTDKLLTINPYSEHTSVPSKVTIKFAEGPDYEYEAMWQTPDSFEGFRFNTYREKINVPSNGMATAYEFSAALAGKGTIPAQTMHLNVNSLDYIIDEWSFISGIVDEYVANAGELSNPNTHYYFNNPFEEKISKLPSEIDNPYASTYAGAPSKLPVFWELVEEDMGASGTITFENGNYVSRPKVIQGRVYGPDGQPLGTKISASRWDYLDIAHPQGNAFQPMKPPEFVFSDVTGRSAHSKYRLTFVVRSHSAPHQVKHEHRIFIPQDEDPSKIKGASGVAYPADHPYRLVWDEQALESAKTSPSSGKFYLGNDDLVVKLESGENATYSYSRPYVTEVDLGFGMGAEHAAIYVVNPIAPIYNYDAGSGLTLPIRARGRINLESGILLNDYDSDYLIEALWAPEGGSAPVIAEGLIGGGIDRNFPITVRIRKHSDPSYAMTQTFRIMLVALDMSPEQTINIANHDMLSQASVKTRYHETTYPATAANPYLDSYREIIDTIVTRNGVTDNALNIGVMANGLEGRLHSYEVIQWDPTTIEEHGMVFNKSKQIKVLQRIYNSDIVRRVVSTRFEIESLDLGFGAGMDSAKHNIETSKGLTPALGKTLFVVNPLAPDFTFAGATVPSQQNATELASSKISLKENGAAVGASTYKYAVIWYKDYADGSMLLARRHMLEGGIIDEWKIVVEISTPGGNLVASLVYNIELAFLDMRPTDIFIPYSNVDSKESGVNVSYTSTRYDDMENPYGEEYADLMTHLANASASLSTVKYIYVATGWSEIKQEAGSPPYTESLTVTVEHDGVTEEFFTSTPVLKRTAE